ncbi:MAG: tRNA lysidine(34) synthetase TilS [Bacteroidetes bacterium]|nr:tRNA lysidine(34) synthetase TilS [Bacteroidota bacterium]
MLPVKRFTGFIEQHGLFDHDTKILAAVSGGMDSVLMAHLLQHAEYTFGIAHCNFKLRGEEADADQLFVKNLAASLGVPFHTIDFDTAGYAGSKKISIQMAARDLRYQWFGEISQRWGYGVTALAHHQNDAIETILLNLTRGTGIAGMHGILPKNGSLVRPLLFLKRVEIQEIVEKNGLAYVEDSSNSSAKYARNKIRLEVIPKLRELNPALEETFERNLGHFRNLEIVLANKLNELSDRLLVRRGHEIDIPIEEVKKLRPQAFLLFGLLSEFGFNESTVHNIISSLDKHPGRVFESGNFSLVLDRQKLILSPKINEETRPAVINMGDRETYYGNYILSVLHDESPLIVRDNPMAVSVDAALLVYPLTIRSWEQSDYFYPLGMQTRKKLSDFFVGQKVPLHEKKQIPLLVNGNGDIIWIGGYRPDNRYKVSANTKKVTIFELNKL